jgi:hypothetical protein
MSVRNVAEDKELHSLFTNYRMINGVSLEEACWSLYAISVV